MRVAIVRAGPSNARSIANMLFSAGIPSDLLTEAQSLRTWPVAVLPGVGKFDASRQALEETGWDEAIRDLVNSGSGRLLGVCLGAQMLGVSSEEGVLHGLGLLNFQTRRLPLDAGFNVPTIGWDTLTPDDTAPEWIRPALVGRYYFSHSFFMDAPQELVISRDSSRGLPVVVGNELALGVQFHPEKSHRHGRSFLSTLMNRGQW